MTRPLILVAATMWLTTMTSPGYSGSKYSKQIKKANELYANERYKDALSVYSKILKQYPKSKKARLQFAKTLYRLENYKDAYRMFKAFNPKKLSQEDNFEAGMSAFSEKDYKMASVSFSYLSPTFIQYDLACYYGGASFNLGEHEIAKQYFSKAHVLPSKLMEHKMIYLNYIENPPSEQNSKNSKNTQPIPADPAAPGSYDFLHSTQKGTKK